MNEHNDSRMLRDMLKRLETVSGEQGDIIGKAEEDLAGVRGEVLSMLQRFIEHVDNSTFGYVSLDENGAVLAINRRGSHFLGGDGSPEDT